MPPWRAKPILPAAPQRRSKSDLDAQPAALPIESVKIPNHRALSLTLLALAAGAYVADRYVFATGPASASAAEPTADAAPRQAPPRPQPSRAELVSVGQRLASVQVAADSMTTPDALQLPDEWRKPVAQTEAPKAAPVPDALKLFHARLTMLTSGAGGLRVQVVSEGRDGSPENRATLALGDEFEGLKLAAIDPKERSATFELDGREVVLRMSQEKVKGSR